MCTRIQLISSTNYHLEGGKNHKNRVRLWLSLRVLMNQYRTNSDDTTCSGELSLSCPTDGIHHEGCHHNCKIYCFYPKRFKMHTVKGRGGADGLIYLKNTQIHKYQLPTIFCPPPLPPSPWLVHIWSSMEHHQPLFWLHII